MRRFQWAVIFLFSLAWFSFFQPWGSFIDPDAFYHAKMAMLLSDQGILRSFPWLDLTNFAHPFTNQHFLFHVLLGPFVRTFGMLKGNQIAAVFFAAVCATAFFLVLRGLRIRGAWLWTALFAALPPVIVRLSLGKASPLAIALFLFGVLAFLRRRHLGAFLVGIFFILLHGGWPLLFVAYALALCGEAVYELLVRERKISVLLRNWFSEPASPVRTFAALLLGTVVGFLLHPYAGSLLQFLLIQIGHVAIATPLQEVRLGTEWYPYTPLHLARDLSLGLIAGLVVCFGLVFAMRKNLESKRMREVLSLSILLAFLFALTLKSARFVEYFAPLFILWLALLSTCIDKRRFFLEAREIGKALQFILVLAVFALFARGAWVTRGYLYKDAMPFSQFAKAIEALDAHAEDGERIYHSNWAVFPQLFALDDRLKYVSGLDPTFLLEREPDLSGKYNRLMTGAATGTAYAFVHDELGARFAFIDLVRNQNLLPVFEQDARWEIIYRDDEAAIFEAAQ